MVLELRTRFELEQSSIGAEGLLRTSPAGAEVSPGRGAGAEQSGSDSERQGVTSRGSEGVMTGMGQQRGVTSRGKEGQRQPVTARDSQGVTSGSNWRVAIQWRLTA